MENYESRFLSLCHGAAFRKKTIWTRKCPSHKNGQRDDNRIENPELWSTAQPSGQGLKIRYNGVVSLWLNMENEVLRQHLDMKTKGSETDTVQLCLSPPWKMNLSGQTKAGNFMGAYALGIAASFFRRFDL